MAGNARSFALDLQGFVPKSQEKASNFIRLIALDLYSRITKRTPVDTGRARAGWAISVNAPSNYVPPEGTAVQLVQSDLSGFNLDQVIYIVNNVNYIVYLEDGTSKQAPAGMVAISMAEIEAELEATFSL